jgi:hypothetical protein
MALLADAEEHNTAQLPIIAGIRLSDFYKTKRCNELSNVDNGDCSTQD